MEIHWFTDKSFVDSSGNELRVLQRRLSDLNNAAQDELLPFFNEEALLQTSLTERETLSYKGHLDKFQSENGVVSITFSDMVNNTHANVQLKYVEESILTVWRVNNMLDALQYNLTAKTGRIYLQVGGGGLLEFFQSVYKQESNIEHAIKLFNNNLLIHRNE